MPSDVALHRIQPDQCPQVVALHRAVFSPKRVARTIYASPGVGRYLASLLAYPQWQKDHALWGAWDGENLVGYAHFRALPESWHLNYIAVLPDHQGCGIGRMLWEQWNRIGQRLGYSLVSLDVDHEDQIALDWYERRGLHIVETAWTYEKRRGAATLCTHGATTVSLLDWDQAEASQRTYGFSRFRLGNETGVWTIGRLGKCYFRTVGTLPIELEAVLLKIDAARRLLAVSSVSLFDANLHQVGVSFRMRGSVTPGTTE